MHVQRLALVQRWRWGSYRPRRMDHGRLRRHWTKLEKLQKRFAHVQTAFVSWSDFLLDRIPNIVLCLAIEDREILARLIDRDELEENFRICSVDEATFSDSEN